MKKLIMATLIALAAAAMPAHAQLGVKTNLLYDATTTPNLGLELGLKGKSTLNLVYGLNPWTFHSKSKGERKAKHWVLMPEYRWYTCQRFSGHFLGFHALGGEFNAGNVDLPFPGFFFRGDDMRTQLRDYRFEGHFLGAGLTYGYQWILSKHFNLEAEIGVGYGHIWLDKYACGDCGSKLYSGHSNYAGITKLGLSIMYLF
ncbi:MAG: DUF3575 domain-containing protein [Bacteroidales bacterium]|nr:DUF3575 domain-containing protein [Bacteroidales bacterium]